VGLVVFSCVVAAIVFSTGFTAGAEPAGGEEVAQSEVGQAQARLAQLRVDANTSYQAYSNALFELGKLDSQIENTSSSLEDAEETQPQL
jgi:hypothetical protein